MCNPVNYDRPLGSRDFSDWQLLTFGLKIYQMNWLAGTCPKIQSKYSDCVKIPNLANIIILASFNDIEPHRTFIRLPKWQVPTLALLPKQSP